MLDWFKKKQKYICGGVKSLEINDKISGSKSIIKFRQPTGDEMLNYVHTQISDNDENLKNFGGKSVDLHKNIREKKFIPYAKKIIVDVIGYVDSNGKETKNIEDVVKYFPQHLELVCSVAFIVDEIYKKKS